MIKIFKKILALLVLILLITPVKAETANVWQCFEISFKASNKYKNPYLDVDLWGEFKGPNGAFLKIPAFWDGGNTWKIRFAPTYEGIWKWSTICNTNDPGLSQKKGDITAIKQFADSSLDNNTWRGFIKISDNGRYFQYADGKPFYWLGDTYWDGCSVSQSDFNAYINDRKPKGFDLVQIRAWVHEFKPDSVVDVNHFKQFDKKVEMMIDSGMVPCLFGFWGWSDILEKNGPQSYKRYWKYLIARYCAYNVIWSLSGEYYFTANVEGWRELGQYVDVTDPYKHPTTAHSTAPHSGSRHYQSDSWYDFNMPQIGHCASLSKFAETLPYIDYLASPTKPSIMSESWYEYHPTRLGEGNFRLVGEDIRYVTYVPLLQGCIGQTYGAWGIFQWCPLNDTTNEKLPWDKALVLPVSGQMKILRQVVDSLTWWKLEPHPEIVSSMMPARIYAASVPGKEYFIYTLGGTADIRIFLPPVGPEPEKNDYPAQWVNPRTGEWTAAKTKAQWYGSFLLVSATPPDAQDWILIIKRKEKGNN
jgi:hypothetical protein